MTSLLGRFDEFYQAVYGVTPFPWQTRLATSVAGGDAWPAWLALPTATGKTACIDIAVFALACQAARRPEQRTAPRRIFFVIDRRVVVDQAYQRASTLAAKLESAESGIVAEVAAALRHIGGGPAPLRAFQLRGGIYRDEAWVRSPVQPTVIASTVDQIGSRLLFRGYGLRRGYDRPIHAALVTNDALIILDEAHCAEPFRQTVEACRAYRARGVHMPTTPFDFSVMSATPPVGATGHLFALDDLDLQHPVIAARLGASKPARLVEAAAGRGVAGERRFAQAIAGEALGLGGDVPRAVGVIVNRVATARAVHEILDAKAPGRSLLLTGRMRMVDRDHVMADLAPLQTGAARPGSERTRYVVATQCIEVGADLDFDALVTECASLDALRQRFGRLNRAGRDTLADAAIVIRSDQAQNEDIEKQDPVYGASLTGTWAWLNSVAENGVVNLGITAIERLLSGVDRTAFESPRVNAPVMLPAYLGAWVQTSPAPAPDPDVAVFLHGPQSGSADVMVCFRSDLYREPEQGVGSPPSSAGVLPLDSVIELLAACPPTSRECMSLPLAAVRRWLVGEDAPSGADVESVELSDDKEAEDREGQEVDRLAFAWRGADDTVQVSRANVKMLRPGDTLVVPTQLPDWEHLGHVPVDGLRSPDVGDECHTVLRLRPVMRLTSDLAADWGPAAKKAAADLIDGQEVDEVAVSELLASVRDNTDLVLWRRTAAECLLADRNRVAVLHPAGGLLIRVSRLPSRERLARLRAAFSDVVSEDLISSDDESSAASVEVPLEVHLNGVRDAVGSICRAVGLPAALSGDLMLAAGLHDIGKADPRFQAWLRGGHRFLGGLEPLAKSGGLPTSPRERSAARIRAGYPKGGRHELLSVRLADAAGAALAGAGDLDLVLHLIASHHGRCRPFAPVVQDPEGSSLTCSLPTLGIEIKGLATGLEQFGSGVAERFWSLNERYGVWGLAWLETLLRLGDRIRSEREQIRDMDEEAAEGSNT